MPSAVCASRVLSRKTWSLVGVPQSLGKDLLCVIRWALFPLWGASCSNCSFYRLGWAVREEGSPVNCPTPNIWL